MSNPTSKAIHRERTYIRFYYETINIIKINHTIFLKVAQHIFINHKAHFYKPHNTLSALNITEKRLQHHSSHSPVHYLTCTIMHNVISVGCTLDYFKLFCTECVNTDKERALRFCSSSKSCGMFQLPNAVCLMQ